MTEQEKTSWLWFVFMLYLVGLFGGCIGGADLANKQAKEQCLLHQEMEVNGTRFKCEVIDD